MIADEYDESIRIKTSITYHRSIDMMSLRFHEARDAQANALEKEERQHNIEIYRNRYEKGLDIFTGEPRNKRR